MGGGEATRAGMGRARDGHGRNARTIAGNNPRVVEPRLSGGQLVNGRFYGSPFAPFDAEGRPSDAPPFRPGE